jgi:hypothetical protein
LNLGVLIALLGVLSASYGWVTTHLVSKREVAVIQQQQVEVFT